eukprot:1156730-Pleurochrysis_carterae.AAC.1
MLPGGRDPKVYNSYRTEAVLLRLRPSECALPVQANPERACAPVPMNQPPPEEELPPEAQTCPDGSSRPVVQTDNRKPRQHVELNIASNARALHATRSKRHSDQHVRGLQNKGKHIGFVVDSGCTYHIHPNVHDLINIRSCSETVSGVDGKPRPCVALGDLPLTVRDSRNKLRVVNPYILLY